MKYVNLSMINKNLREIRKEVKNKKIYAVVKADAYGYGLIEMVRFLIEQGISDFCVSNKEEALKLRELNENIKILLLSDFSLGDIDILKEKNITVTISNLEKIKLINNMNVELKINTGMNRYGIKAEDFYTALDLISKMNLRLEGIYTHMAGYLTPYFYEQYLKFSKLVKDIKNINIHFASSKGIALDMDIFNSVRVGMALYSDNSLSINERISNIVECKKDEYVGYNDYKMGEDGYVGVINIGYDDGLIRMNKGRYVHINDDYYKIISVCMNHTLILIDKKINIGDKVELLGEKVKLDYVSSYLRSISYEVLTSFKNQKIVYEF